MHRLRRGCGSCGAHPSAERSQTRSMRQCRPRDDLEAAVRMLSNSRATFDPIAAIDVADAGCLLNGGMMNVPADDAVDAVAVRFRRQSTFELADKIHGILDLQFRPFRQGPIGEAEQSAYLVEYGIGGYGAVIGLVTEQREPARMPDHDVEQPAPDDGIAAPVDANVDRALGDFDAAEMHAAIFAQELVVIARYVDDTGSFAHFAQELLQHIIMRLWPMPARFELPSVDDVADEINDLCIVMTEKFDQPFGLAPARPEMNVRQKQGPEPPRATSLGQHAFVHSTRG